ncbi:hypothetical protein [Methylobacter sp. YRD-M1]|uniref:hypothetical protein n=1 Tax=Methylobacter sp. YRD-M1 TaxID=2911520 RepID=UPI00227B32D3|nr:hypothetical protein [Methylobacter sp. YRD-M1]WAK04384.1 hypothetical protein LZ558_22215 [Methylobacter sp. YRD-M1]
MSFNKGTIRPVEPEAVLTEDGYLFFRVSNGHYVDNPACADLGYSSLAQLTETVDIMPPKATAKRLVDYHGWTQEELAHAISAIDHVYSAENAVKLANGREIRWPSAACTYVRVVQSGFELAYWSSASWRFASETTMAAILVCSAGGKR